MSKLIHQFLPIVIWLCAAFGMSQTTFAEPEKDLNPVTLRPAPKHAPVTLVANGKPVASIAVMVARRGPLGQAVANLQTLIERTTGAKLSLTDGKLPEGPAIVIGDCELARKHGIDVKRMPIDGFTIKTAPGFVLIVGRDEALGGGATSSGTAWGVFEFLERYVGVRWYFPEELGQSIVASKSLSVAPVCLEDAPAFRMREIWPPMSDPWFGKGTPLAPLQTFLRTGNSWPHRIRVHQPNWATVQEYREQRPEVFQLRTDGTRDHFMICYGNPRTLETYLENIDRHVRGEKPAHVGISGNAITVSPNDAEIACNCEHCRKLWNKNGGQYGSASRIVAKFVADLAVAVKKRWPDKTVVYLPYFNYTLAPDGIEFPDNVEVQLCGMPGLAQYKEPAIALSEQANIDKWFRLTGRKIQNWHYSCWPANRTKVMYQYPHTIQQFYQQNRDKTVGTFINGEKDHWPRHHLSLYCWLKLLWNPDFNVDAAIEAYCRRMYGPAAETVQELVELQISGWERSRWPHGRLSPAGLHKVSFPHERVEQMRLLLEKARTEVASDEPAAKRLAYFAAPFAAFFHVSKSVHGGTGLTPLLIEHVDESPKIDGKLDDPVWKRAKPVPFVRGWDETQKLPTYPTSVQAVWTTEAVTFGFRMTEPTPELLERKVKGRDDSMAWWDDCVEILFDVTGRHEGEFHHFIINANGAVADAKGPDYAWNVERIYARAFVGPDFWSLEVQLPFDVFPNAVKPTSGKTSMWLGNFTRHRVADRGLKQSLRPRMGSEREYSRMNTFYAKPSNNQVDFARFKFVNSK
ncbi:MAG: DUF4838 domain-containing protein [Planctomycetota bacterium]|nr:DUF4838 domain-containing protein [Planctomycetota bacterium]